MMQAKTFFLFVQEQGINHFLQLLAHIKCTLKYIHLVRLTLKSDSLTV